MNPVVVRNVKIGEGIPKICVPIVGVTKEEIIQEAKSFETIPVDVAEWRADWFEDVFDMEKVREVLMELRARQKPGVRIWWMWRHLPGMRWFRRSSRPCMGMV